MKKALKKQQVQPSEGEDESGKLWMSQPQHQVEDSEEEEEEEEEEEREDVRTAMDLEDDEDDEDQSEGDSQ